MEVQSLRDGWLQGFETSSPKGALVMLASSPHPRPACSCGHCCWE